ncbi:MAG: hypothetical protein GX811_04240, partial [Lentisphaerae bacterium]|nr:hypothetical protein [Lentisphaerota bacterium]
MRRLAIPLWILSVCVILLNFLIPAAADTIRLGDVTLDYKVPSNIGVYDLVTIECKLTGTGDVSVQAVATDLPAHERFFDSAIPFRVGFEVEYLSEKDDNAEVRVTNIGNTVWKSAGHGKVSITPIGELSADLAPGKSITRTVQVSKLRPEDGSDDQRKFVLAIDRDDNRRLPDGITRIEMVIDNCVPGKITSKKVDLEAVPRYDFFEEFGQAYARLELEEQKTASTSLKVLVPPSSDRLVIRLIKEDGMKAVSVPINPSVDSLKLSGKPNKRWVLDGKPIFVVSNVSTDDIPKLRERLGGSNVVIACRRQLSPDSPWLKAVREHGFKILPISMAYIRLQNIGKDAGI